MVAEVVWCYEFAIKNQMFKRGDMWDREGAWMVLWWKTAALSKNSVVYDMFFFFFYSDCTKRSVIIIASTNTGSGAAGHTLSTCIIGMHTLCSRFIFFIEMKGTSLKYLGILYYHPILLQTCLITQHGCRNVFPNLYCAVQIGRLTLTSTCILCC